LRARFGFLKIQSYLIKSILQTNIVFKSKMSHGGQKSATNVSHIISIAIDHMKKREGLQWKL